MARERAVEKAVAAWLLACCALVLVTLVQGGVTRLTRSGLSIAEWKPVSGVIPPLTDEQWSEEFAAYQRTPEFQLVNPRMTPLEFRSIFWMEWAHRVLARSTVLAIILPLLLLAAAREIPGGFAPRLAAMALLVSFQGALGWYMVHSGLIKDPHVSHYRLTAHLIAATCLYAFMFWSALDLLSPRRPEPPTSFALRRLGDGATALVFLTIVSGGLVAGLKAGFLYGTFPRMGGSWLPPHWLELRPLILNFLQNGATVQLEHRVLGLSAGLAVVSFWACRLAARGPRPRPAVHLLPVFAALQVALGVLTLVNGVPAPLASCHQANALLLLTACLFVRHGS